MKSIVTGALAAVFLLTICFTVQKRPKKILVFSKTVGYRHASIGAGKTAILQLGAQNGFVVDTTENASLFNKKQLKQYAAVLFLNTTGDVLDSVQQTAFTQYIQNGGGFVGVHAASDTEYDWPWFGKLVGAYFINHPKTQPAHVLVKDHQHIATKHLPAVWKRTDEWYNFKDIAADITVLLTIDETSYTGGENGADHPMSWYHAYDGGRAFYTALGHTEASYTESEFLQHLLGGIQYAMGK